MQVNVVGMLDNLFQTVAGKNGAAAKRETATEAMQGTQRVNGNKGVIRTRMSDESKAAGIYEGEAQTENEFASQLQTIQQQLNAMINEMSGEDCAGLHGQGISITSSDMEKLVTVVDEIKVRLAAYSENYVPTGDIDQADLEAVLGSAGMAAEIARKLESYDLPVTDENVEEISSAMKMEESLTPVTREQAAYLAANKLSPSIENVYRVQHSGVAGTAATEPLSEEQWQELRPQAEQIIADSGEAVTEENLETARWMIENGIELNTENLTAITSYTGLDGISSGDKLGTILSAMAKGKGAEGASLLGESYGPGVVAETLENLEEYVAATYPEEDTTPQAITARRQLEEIRLMMTTEAGLSLLKKGIEIQTEPLEKLVEELKNQEQEAYRKLYASEGVAWSQAQEDIVKQTENCRQELAQMPSYLAGSVLKSQLSASEQITMRSSLEAGQQVKSTLEQAGRDYESLMTKPDREYGDSIKEAFRNVDALLESMGEETTAENERCVRILAYNQMEIHSENLSRIKELDAEYQYLLTNLTPRVTLHMVQKRWNPLDTEIHELNDKIEEIKQEIGPSEDEKYSEFLWKLDQNSEITREERDGYIGLYRLLNTVNRQDEAAIGALVNQGSDVTLENLLTASRSRKSRNMDVKVDEAFGMAEGVWQKNSITDQLKVFYQTSSQESTQYQQQIAERLKTLRENGQAQQLLAESGQQVTVDNLEAASVLTGESDTELKKYWEKQENQEKLEDFYRHLTGKEEMVSAYGEIEEELSEEVEKECAGGIAAYPDVEEMRLYYHTARLMTKLSAQEEYHIPMEYNGEVTDIHLKVIHDGEDSGKVAIETTLPAMGKISAEFTVSGGKLSGMVLGESAKVSEELEKRQELFHQVLQEAGVKAGRIHYGTSSALPAVSSKQESPEAQGEMAKATTAELYDVAKAFLYSLKR